MNLLARLIKALITGKERKKEGNEELLPSEKEARPVSSSLEENLGFVRKLFKYDNDVAVGDLEILEGQGRAGILYINGLADKEGINEHLIAPLMARGKAIGRDAKSFQKNRLQTIRTQLLNTVDVIETNRMEEVLAAVLKGDAGLFVDGVPTALIIGSRKYEKRPIDKPDTEVTVRGGQEAFVENLGTNFSLLRQRLPTPDLRYRAFKIGRLSRTEVRLAWVEGIANPQIIEEARLRLGRIDVDYVHGIAMIAELMEDNTLSLWSQVGLTERPDVLAANIAEGRLAVFCDGSPFVMMAPKLFWQNLHTVDDYSERPVLGSFFRLIRQGAFYVSLTTTSIYVALVSFHQALIPPVLSLRITAGREAVPFPTLLETLLLTLIIDILREAGVRLPKNVGSAVGILGAVVIGQAAVSAGFVSPALIIVVAISAIANFSIPSVSLANASRVANYFLIILAGTLGLFGVVWGMVFLLWQIVSLRSFGVPIFYPMAPGGLYGLMDTVIRMPIWKLRQRPSLLSPKNRVRMGQSTVKPRPPSRRSSDN